MVELFDIVELLVTVRRQTLQPGTRGAVVDVYSDQACEIEFTNSCGKTIAQLAQSPEQFAVIWRAKTQF